jgi:hypothetical protein
VNTEVIATPKPEANLGESTIVKTVKAEKNTSARRETGQSVRAHALGAAHKAQMLTESL